MGGKAMVIDDAADIRRLLEFVLSMAGFTVVQAGGGTEAVRLLSGDDLPDVVLLDVQMPDLDGWDTLAHLRGNPRTARLPVVLCSVKGSPQDSLRGWTLGCDGFVGKPVDISALVTEIEAVLARGDAERQAVRDAWIRALS